jgi:hypothetical protein
MDDQDIEDILEIPMAVNMYWDPTSKVRYIYSYIYIDKMCIYPNVSIIVYICMYIWRHLGDTYGR